MNLGAPIHHSYHLIPRTVNRRLNRVSLASTPILRISELKYKPIFISNCIPPSNEVAKSIARISPIEEEKDENVCVVKKTQFSEGISENSRDELSENDSLWIQMMEIAKFSGPAVGLWVCGPLMSLIDTAVIGQSSSIELAALGSIIIELFFLFFSFTYVIRAVVCGIFLVAF